jgi:hypothetical protein
MAHEGIGIYGASDSLLSIRDDVVAREMKNLTNPFRGLLRNSIKQN